jgi:hypothetical protein
MSELLKIWKMSGHFLDEAEFSHHLINNFSNVSCKTY